MSHKSYSELLLLAQFLNHDYFSKKRKNENKPEWFQRIIFFVIYLI